MARRVGPGGSGQTDRAYHTSTRGAAATARPAISEDGGRTWSEVMRTNFPDSMSRTFAGRLSDGRFFQVGNSTRVLMDRNFLALSLSDDGAKFGKMVQLVREPTAQRFAGHLKCHGYQYPSCVVDGDRLLIGHSVNKEDIAVGIVDTTAV